MEPVSVATSVVGLLGAAGKITSVLYGLVTKIKDAPSLARTAVAEISDITAALGQLQAYVLGTVDPDPARSNLLLLEQVLATLSGCVITLSELEAIIDGMVIVPTMGLFDSAMWSLKEPEIKALVQRLQNNKTSLTLMLTILQCKSSEEAHRSMQKLQCTVDLLLQSNQELAARLSDLRREGSMISEHGIDNLSTIRSNETPRSRFSKFSLSAFARSISFSFEEDLQSSRVYRKASYSHSQTSLTSSARFSTALSVFSGFTLAQVSSISVFALPVYPEDLHNSQWYTFGDAGVGTAVSNKMAPRVIITEAPPTQIKLDADISRHANQGRKRILGSNNLFNQRLARENIYQRNLTPERRKESTSLRRPSSPFPKSYVDSMHYIG